MSTLRHALAARGSDAAAADAPCHVLASQPPSLQVEASDGVRWILPWSHFAHGRHRVTGAEESLVLMFAQQEVVLSGDNLGALADAAAGLRLESIRAWSETYRAVADAAPFIRQILVRDTAGTSSG